MLITVGLGVVVVVLCYNCVEFKYELFAVCFDCWEFGFLLIVLYIRLFIRVFDCGVIVV